MQRRCKSMPVFAGQRGVSLIETLMATALFSVGVAAFVTSFGSYFKEAKSGNDAGDFAFLDQHVQNIVLDKVGNFFDQSKMCGSSHASDFKAMWSTYNGGVTSDNVEFKLVNSPLEVPASVKARCQNQTDSIGKDETGIYFCLEPDPGSLDANIRRLINRYAIVVEVHYGLFDAKTFSPMPCKSLEADPKALPPPTSKMDKGEATAKVIYTIHWQQKAPNGTSTSTFNPKTHSHTNMVEGRLSYSLSSYVIALFNKLLGRQPSATDLDWFLTHFDNSTPRGDIARRFLEDSTAQEYIGRKVKDYYLTYLRREGDINTEGKGFVTALSSKMVGRHLVLGSTHETVISQFVGSGEYFTKFIDSYKHTVDTNQNPAFVRKMYHDLTDRPPTQSEMDYCTNHLDNGTMSRKDLAYGLTQTDDYRSRLLDSWYQAYLGRPIDNAAKTYWLNQFNTLRDEDIQQTILASPEFRDRMRYVQ